MLTLPKFVLQKKFMMESVLFVFVFSIIYMFLYRPFSSTAWFSFSSWRLALLTIGYYLVAITIMLLSKMVLLIVQKRVDVTALTYSTVFLAEFLLLSFFYVLFTVAFDITEVELSFPVVLKTSFCVLLILVVPYTIFLLHTAYRSLRDENRMLRALLERASEVEGKTQSAGNLDLYDTFGTVKLSIDPDSIYYIESQDNYVKIWYEVEGKLVSYMLRCRTQQMEKMLDGTEIRRCHRSYFVNFSKVSRLDRSSGRTTITLSHPDMKAIPVSKTYYRTVIAANLRQSSAADA